MLRVLEIINLAGSAKSFIGEQLAALRERGGCEVHLICSPGGDIERWCDERGVHYCPVRIERAPSPLRDIAALARIFAYMRRHHFDVVICHQEKARLLGTLSAWLLRVPTRIIYAHGVLLDTMHGLKRRLFLTEGTAVSRLAHRVVCVSPSVARRRAEIGMDNPAKQVVIGRGTCNGIDTRRQFNPALVNDEQRRLVRERLGLAPGDFVVGFCGRLVRDKGITELAHAVELLAGRYPERTVRLLVIGDFERRDAVPAATAQFLLHSPLVAYAGRVAHEQIATYYTLMDVIALPSYREGFGLVTAEAGAMGVPAVVSRSTGCIDSIVEGTTGLYADINPTDIADKLERMLDSDYARRLGLQAREHIAACYERDDVVRATVEFILEESSKIKN